MSSRLFRATLRPILFATLAASMPALAATPSAPIAAAVAHNARPTTDSSRDAARKPAEMLAFAGVQPGMTIVDMMPGAGYFTRLFAIAVGPKGKVHGWLPATASDQAVARFTALAAEPAYPNVALMPKGEMTLVGTADIVWTSQNYHDLHNRGQAVATNEAAFKALKKGGVYVVLDHSARAGTGVADTQTLHRIDVEAVKAEVVKAGFVLAGSSDALSRPEDDRSVRVYDLRDKTDQFILKFRKP